MFSKKFPRQNARQIKNPRHKMLRFWCSARINERQLTKTVKGMPKIHSVLTTKLVGIIEVRNRSCFCILCENNHEYATNEAGKKKIVLIIYSS